MRPNIKGLPENLTAAINNIDSEVLMFIMILASALLVMLILDYIFSSLAVYRFIKNRNLDNAVLAWIPLVGEIFIGKVYDNINEKQGKKTNFASMLLLFYCIYSLSYGLYRFNLVLLSICISSIVWPVILVLKLICYNLIFKKYTPNNSTYFVLTVIFTIIPIIPFIPGLCLLKASKNQPVC